MERNRVVVTIFGKDYSLVSDVDPEYIKKAADYLDSKMKEVSGNYPSITETRVAVLAALNIADELFHSRGDTQGSAALERQISELTRKISEAL
jgi:cell division protein ZapA